MKRAIHWLAVALLLTVGCTQSAQLSHESSAQVVYKPSVTHSVGNGEVIDFNIPGEAWHDSQKCYIYRDLEFKTSSISCPSDRLGAIKMDGP